MKFISVIIVTYNGATRGYLSQSIESVLSQRLDHFELIIVDDGSSDETSQLCKSYLNDSRVRYVYQPNKGPAAARNKGIEHATHDYISFLDDDDHYEPDYLQKQLQFLSAHPDPKIGMSYTALNWIDQKGSMQEILKIPSNGDIYESLFFGNVITTSAVMCKKEVFQNVGRFKEHLLGCEDYDLWIRIAKCYHIYSYDEPLVNYRFHQNNMSLNFEKMQFYHLYVLFMAIQEAPEWIKAKKDHFYHKFYECCAAQYLGVGNFKEFQKQYQLCKLHGSTQWHWKVKYAFSQYPSLFKFFRRMKRGLLS